MFWVAGEFVSLLNSGSLSKMNGGKERERSAKEETGKGGWEVEFVAKLRLCMCVWCDINIYSIYEGFNSKKKSQSLISSAF